MTSLYDFKQIDIMTFDLQGQGGQNGGQNTKNHFNLLTIDLELESQLIYHTIP